MTTLNPCKEIALESYKNHKILKMKEENERPRLIRPVRDLLTYCFKDLLPRIDDPGDDLTDMGDLLISLKDCDNPLKKQFASHLIDIKVREWK